MKYDDLIHSIEKLRPKRPPQILQDHRSDILIRSPTRLVLRGKTKWSSCIGDGLRADIGGHDNDGVPKIDLSSERIGQASILHHLQEQIKHILMRFLNLIKQHNRIRLSSDRFRQLPALFMANIAWRRSDQS